MSVICFRRASKSARVASSSAGNRRAMDWNCARGTENMSTKVLAVMVARARRSTSPTPPRTFWCPNVPPTLSISTRVVFRS